MKHFLQETDFSREEVAQIFSLARRLKAERGRRSFVTGDYERYAELYFTTHEPGGRYGNVTVRGNLFVSGPHAAHAITFAPGGDTILVRDNIFQGLVRDVPPAEGCTNVNIQP